MKYIEQLKELWLLLDYVPFQCTCGCQNWYASKIGHTNLGEDDLTLDLIHEAERKLYFSRRQLYYSILQQVCSKGLSDPSTLIHIQECIKATKEQRLEALLKTLGKWEE
jgi:hypothetical protein